MIEMLMYGEQPLACITSYESVCNTPFMLNSGQHPLGPSLGHICYSNRNAVMYVDTSYFPGHICIRPLSQQRADKEGKQDT